MTDAPEEIYASTSGHWSTALWGKYGTKYIRDDVVVDKADAWDGVAASNERRESAMWQPIKTAPTDGTLVIIYAPGIYYLPPITCCCAYHPDAGWCVDELRNATHWQPLPEPPAL